MATFPDLSSFDHYMSEVEGRSLTLPIRGREWTWRAGQLTMWAMLKVQHVQRETVRIHAALVAGEDVDREQLILTDDEDRRLSREVVGEQRAAELIDAGITLDEYNLVVRTLITWHVNGETAALAVWTGAKEDKPADPPARAASTKTAGSSKTTRPKTTASRGTRSSNTGRSSKPTSRGSTK